MRKIFKKILIGAVRFYQRAISPYKKSCCRFTPTCSEYAIQAIEKYGSLKGMYLAFRRILRCNPFGDSGYDPLK